MIEVEKGRVLNIKRIVWHIVILFLVPLLYFGGKYGYSFYQQIVEEARAIEAAIENTEPGVMVTETGTGPTSTMTMVVTESVVPSLTIAFQSSISHLPIVYVAEDESEEYEVSLMPLNFNGTNEHTNDELVTMLKNGEIDILFTNLQFLSTNGNVGKIIFPIDQSYGGDQIVSWNESITQTLKLAVVENSRGYYLSLADLRINEVDLEDIEFVFTETDEEAVQLFLKKEVDTVAGRIPAISRATLAGGHIIGSSETLPIMFDVAIASNKALAGNNTAIKQFIFDWYRTQKLIQEDPELVAEIVSYWRHNLEATNGWTRIYRDTALMDWGKSSQFIASTSLEDSITLMQTPTIFSDLLLDSYSIQIWSSARVPDFDVEIAFEPSFVLELSEDDNTN